MGVYDLPIVIDYILAMTRQPKLSYIGHSMGTTMFYVLLSEKPEYNEKVRVMIGMAPIAFINHVKSPMIRFLATISDPLAVSESPVTPVWKKLLLIFSNFTVTLYRAR